MWVARGGFMEHLATRAAIAIQYEAKRKFMRALSLSGLTL